MTRKDWRSLTLPALALLVGLAPCASGQAQNDRYQTHQFAWGPYTFHIPCALGGAGEDVTVSGAILFQEHTVIDGSGGWHYSWFGTPLGLTGAGVTSGEVYHFTGETHYSESGSALPYVSTFVNEFHIVGPHTKANSRTHQLVHVAIRPDGTTAVSFDKPTGSCQAE